MSSILLRRAPAPSLLHLGLAQPALDPLRRRVEIELVLRQLVLLRRDMRDTYEVCPLLVRNLRVLGFEISTWTVW